MTLLKDRILYFSKSEVIHQSDYSIDHDLLISDHRPVFGDFTFKSKSIVKSVCSLSAHSTDDDVIVEVSQTEYSQTRL